MQKITIRITKAEKDLINSFVGPEKLYPTEADYVRAAVRDFLVEETPQAETFEKSIRSLQDPIPSKKIQQYANKVQVQMDRQNGIAIFKDYQLIHR